MATKDLKRLVENLASKKKAKKEVEVPTSEEEIEGEEELSTEEKEIVEKVKPEAKQDPVIDEDLKVQVRMAELQNNGIYRAEKLYFQMEQAKQLKRIADFLESLNEEE